MGKYIIEGKNRLSGRIRVQGAKNSALPILAACASVGKPCLIHNCPCLTDIDETANILRKLGCRAERTGNTVSVDSSALSDNCIDDNLMNKLRSSIIFMGALLSRTGEAVISAPGGCDIGLRPFDLHLLAMKKLGAVVTEERGKIICRADRLTGAKINLSFPSVGATENIILAAVRARGVTTVINAAREPEIVDLARFLNSCGARISSAGESTLYIEGVEKLYSSQYSVMSDRIVASTYMAAAAVTGSDIVIEDVIPDHLTPVIPYFEQAGCIIKSSGNRIRIISPQRLKSMETIRTMPYPGFPTDCQAIMTAVAGIAEGITFIHENIFENRMRHINELNRMGADIKVCGKTAVVNGVSSLSGTAVHSTDLRAGAALVTAGLSAEGITTVDNIKYIDRGYENFSENLMSLGAKIKRVDFNEENGGKAACPTDR